MLNYLIICAACLAVLIAGRKGLPSAFAVSLGLLVALPHSTKIELPGSLPELTVHRIILVILLGKWISSTSRRASPAPAARLLAVIAIARVASTLLSVSPVASIKDLLGFLLEVVVFYRVAYSVASTHRASIESFLHSIVMGLSLVAGAVVLDRFTPISPLTLIFPEVPNDPFGAQGTYPHRILYGYAMAMGVPIAMSLLDGSGSKRTKRLLWLGICLMAATCYFSTSRGPWLGLAIALCIMCAMGGKSQRRRCKGIAVLVVAVMIIRPGVWQTIADKYEATFDTNSHKGKSYEYRYRLWHVAISEIGKTPERTLFGHGGLSTETMDLSQYFEKQSGGTTHKLGYTSWDNRYACDLMEFGVVGFALLVWLFGYISIRLGKVWWKGCEAGQAKRAGILAAAFVFVFAQTNVDIFSEQLKFLFWGLTAMGFALGTDLSKVSRRARMPKDVLISAVEPAVR